MIRAVLLSISIFLVSCNGNVVFQERAEVSAGIWSYDSPLSYTFDIVDISKVYDVMLDVEHSRDFGYQNLYAEMQIILPVRDTLYENFSVDLADNFGDWMGTCKGNECSTQIIVKKSKSFLHKGAYTLILDQHSRTDNLEGIKSVELTIAAVDD